MSHVHGREGHHYFTDGGPPTAVVFAAAQEGRLDGPLPVPVHLWDEHLDRLTTLAATMTGCPVARISVLEADRVVCRSSVGAPRLMVPLAQSFCARSRTLVRGAGDVVISNNPATDERFHDLALLPHNAGIRFYLAYPLMGSHGEVIGIFSLRDVLPHVMDETELSVLADLAVLASERLAALHHLPQESDGLAALHLSMMERTLKAGCWSYDPAKAEAPVSWSPIVAGALHLPPQMPPSYYAFLHAFPLDERRKIVACLHRAVRRRIPFTLEATLLPDALGACGHVMMHGEPTDKGGFYGVLWPSGT